MARRRRGRRRGGAGLGGALGLAFGLVGASVLLLAMIGVFVWRQYGEPEIDPVSFCPRDGASALTVIAIDATDPYDAVQVREIDHRVRELLGLLERGHRLDIYTMNAGRGELATRTFSKCNPGHATRLHQVAGQPSEVERIYREEFAEAIEAALSVTIEQGAANRSPIVESVRAIAADSLGDVGQDVPRALILVSDLVQHSDVYSMFRSGVGAFEDFSRTANYADAQTDLRGAEVEVIVIARAEYSAYQTRALLLWWEEYIRENGGQLRDYSRI